MNEEEQHLYDAVYDDMEQFREERDILLSAVRAAVRAHKGDVCRADHHGYCQTHLLEPMDECYVKRLRESLAKLESER